MSDKNNLENEEKVVEAVEQPITQSDAEDEKKEDKAKAKVKKPRRKGKKLIKWIIVLLLLAAACVFVWKNDAAYSFAQKYISFLPERNVVVKNSDYTQAQVERRTISVTLTGTGTLQPIDSYTITSKVTGEIMSANFEEMDVVEKDQVLYTIDSSDIESSIRDYADKVEDAQDALDDLLEDYEDLELYSDYTGICEELYVEEGDNVQKGAMIAHVVDRETMLLEVPFFVQDVVDMRVGQAVQVTVNAATDTISGKITKIGTLETVTAVGAKLRTVTVSVINPGGITTATTAYATVDGIESASAGSFKYNVDETITAEYGGEIETLGVEEGDKISKGALVLKISSETLDDQKETLEKSLRKSKDNYNDFVEKLEDYVITAPIAGTVVQKNYKVSDNLSNSSNGANSAMAIIYDMSKLTFDMSIDELDLSLIEVGQEVEITSDSFNETYTGYITKKSIIGSTSMGTTTYPVTVEVEGNDVLLPGMNVNATIFIKKVENVLAVPVEAIMRGDRVRVLKTADGKPSGEQNGENMPQLPEGEIPDGENMPQFPKGEMPEMPNDRKPHGGNGTNGDFEIVSVVTGVSDDDYVEIVSGLEDGDIVLIEKNAIDGAATVTGNMGGFGGMGGGGMPGGNMSGGNMSGGNMAGSRPGGMGGGGEMPR